MPNQNTFHTIQMATNARAVLFLMLMLVVCVSEGVLDGNYYTKTCPNAEKIILQTVYNASIHDPRVPPRLLRLFFHDCFIRVIVNLTKTFSSVRINAMGLVFDRDVMHQC